MLTTCWSAKGGSGTTVVAAALALTLARSGPTVLADLAGDCPAVLGVPDPAGPGLSDWLLAGSQVPTGALGRLTTEVAPNLGLLHWGGPVPVGALDGDQGQRLTTALNDRELGHVVADCGSLATGAALELIAGATVSLLVVRPCYLALRRVLSVPVQASAVVLVQEVERTLRADDVTDVLGLPVRAQVPWSPVVARAVDAGLLASRLPRPLERAMRDAA